MSFLCERVNQVTTANVYVFSDSVLCMGEMRDDPNTAWMNETKWYSQNHRLKELNRIDDMQTEFERQIFPVFTTIGILEEILKFMKSIQYTSTVVSSSCPCSMKFCGENTTIQKNANRILLKLSSIIADSIAVIGFS